MSGKLKAIINIILWVLIGISLIFVILFYFGKVVPGTEGTNLEEPVITDLALRWSYVMALIATLATLGFSLLNLVLNPKALKQSLLVLLGAIILVVVSYFLASSQILTMTGYEGSGNNPETLKIVGTGLYATYILLAMAFVTIAYVEIVKYFK